DRVIAIDFVQCYRDRLLGRIMGLFCFVVVLFIEVDIIGFIILLRELLFFEKFQHLVDYRIILTFYFIGRIAFVLHPYLNFHLIGRYFYNSFAGYFYAGGLMVLS